MFGGSGQGCYGLGRAKSCSNIQDVVGPMYINIQSPGHQLWLRAEFANKVRQKTAMHIGHVIKVSIPPYIFTVLVTNCWNGHEIRILMDMMATCIRVSLPLCKWYMATFTDRLYRAPYVETMSSNSASVSKQL